MQFPTKLALILAAFTALSTRVVYAIGDQHGVFRSQSTQGDQWMGTATIEDEEFRITVHPDYLDVELDWVFRVGGQPPAKFQDALEIVGNLNLAKNSVVTGILAWWQGDILKGKLKTTTTARADYEAVVQRSDTAPPPPRDPVLMEYGWGVDNYYISIFPAKFGDTRKVRIHYLIPGNSVGGVVKMPYPYSFSDTARVFIKAGSDVASYKIETAKNALPRTNKTLEALSANDYAFHAYGSTSPGERIASIVPVLANEGSGSRIYVGDVSTANLQGQAGHIIVMDAEKIIAQSNLKEDFVILWRWNHTPLLERYAGQIVGQSKLLKAFLAKLDSANKRAALIIDKEGGERITFTLSKPDDAEHKRMTAYLDSLAALAVLDPPVTSVAPNYQLQVDAAKAESEFEAAIQAAIKLFDANDNIRHLLLLTAGPRIINTYSNPVPMKIDSAITVGAFTDYADHLTLGAPIGSDDRTLYWPGTNPGGILSQQTLNLEIEAVVSNGTQLCSLSVATKPDKSETYARDKSEIEKHVFSSAALIPKINWKISQENKVISSFDETAQIVRVDNADALAKIMGASRALTPMANDMPRSMAATVGFIDSSYSLVALEEDKLSAADANTFATAGVPDLFASDIKALPDDLIHIPVQDWLKENPPQRIWNYGTAYGNVMMDKVIVMNDMGPIAAVQGVGKAGALMPFPVSGDVAASSTGSYADYSKDLSAGILSKVNPNRSARFARVHGPWLILEMALVNPSLQGKVQVEIYSLNGMLIHSQSSNLSSTQTSIELPIDNMRLRNGLYLVQVKSAMAQYRQKIMIP